METFVYTLKLNKDYQDQSTWDKEAYEVIEKHYLRLKSDFEIGKVIHVGKTKNAIGGFGFILFNEKSIEDAINYMNKDEAIKKGMMSGTCFSYQVIF